MGECGVESTRFIKTAMERLKHLVKSIVYLPIGLIMMLVLSLLCTDDQSLEE